MSTFKDEEKYKYNNGFGSYQETEAIKGALPVYRNSPQNPPYGLYAEKLSGTAFTAPRHTNYQSWLYRILPACAHTPHKIRDEALAPYIQASKTYQIPNQLRWSPFDIDNDVDFVHGLKMISQAGDPAMKNGLGIYIYTAGKSMGKEGFYSADGDFLIVPQQGTFYIYIFI